MRELTQKIKGICVLNILHAYVHNIGQFPKKLKPYALAQGRTTQDYKEKY